MKARVHLILAGLLILFVIVSGYLVFRYFVTNVAGTPEAYTLLFFAVVAGIATFFSPCSFPLLPGYLALFVTAKGVKHSALYYGLVGAAGIALFNLILGSLIGLAGASFAQSLAITSGTPNPLTLTLRTGIGAVLVFLGIIQFANLPFFTNVFHRIGHRFSRVQEKSAKSIFLYGLGYTAAGLGCAGPIMAGLIVFALASGGFLAALLAFVVYSLTMVAAIVLVSVLVGFAEKRTLTRLQEATPKIKRITAAILVLVGVFLIYSSYNIELFRRLFFP